MGEPEVSGDWELEVALEARETSKVGMVEEGGQERPAAPAAMAAAA